MQRPLGLPEIILSGFIAFGLGVDQTVKETMPYLNRKPESHAGDLVPVYRTDLQASPLLYFDDVNVYPMNISCKSDSMTPTFDCNDIVLGYLDPKADEIKVGDVISYTVDQSCSQAYKKVWGDNVPVGEHILHRVIQLGETVDISIDENGKASQTGTSRFYRLQGDANDSPDPCDVHYESVNAKVAGIIKNGFTPKSK